MLYNKASVLFSSESYTKPSNSPLTLGAENPVYMQEQSLVSRAPSLGPRMASQLRTTLTEPVFATLTEPEDGSVLLSFGGSIRPKAASTSRTPSNVLGPTESRSQEAADIVFLRQPLVV